MTSTTPATADHKRPNYILIWLYLFVLTVIEVSAAFLSHIPKHWLILILLFFAVWKALLVALFFMHLKFERWRLRIISWCRSRWPRFSSPPRSWRKSGSTTAARAHQAAHHAARPAHGGRRVLSRRPWTRRLGAAGQHAARHRARRGRHECVEPDLGAGCGRPDGAHTPTPASVRAFGGVARD